MRSVLTLRAKAWPQADRLFGITGESLAASVERGVTHPVHAHEELLRIDVIFIYQS